MRGKCARLWGGLAIGVGLFSALGCLAKDREPPELTINSPSRASLSQEASVRVEGIAVDSGSGIAQVWVSGVEAELDESGRFIVDLPTQNGAFTIHTSAIDNDGNEATDTRTVLVGEFARTDEALPDSVLVSIDAPSFSTVGTAAESAISDVGLEALIAPQGALQVGSGSCLQATIDIGSVESDDIQIKISPTDGGIDMKVVILGLELGADADYDVVCIGGSAPIVVEADRVEINTTLALAIENDALSATLTGTTTDFDNLRFSVGVLPSEIAELLIDDLDLELGTLLSNALSEAIEPIITESLLGLADERQFTLLGTEITIRPQPTRLDFTTQRGIVGIAPRFSSESSKGAVYLSNPTPAPVMSGLGVELAVVDDALNQALAVLWVSGALEQNIDLVTENGDLGFGIADGIEIAAPLPPVAGVDEQSGALAIHVGDLAVSFVQGELTTKVAANLTLSISTIEQDGDLGFVVHGGSLQIDRVGDDGFLSDGDMDVLSGVATELIRSGINELIGTLPIPEFYGVLIQPPVTSAGPGYLRISTALSQSN